MGVVGIFSSLGGHFPVEGESNRVSCTRILVHFEGVLANIVSKLWKLYDRQGERRGKTMQALLFPPLSLS